MTGFDVTFVGAFVAGLLSFLSPCVLPLVPAYLCFLGGFTMEELAAKQKSEARSTSLHVFWMALVFVAGFSTVFVALGATASLAGQFLADNLDFLGILAGIVIVLLGLHFLGLLPIQILYRQLRFPVMRQSAGLLGAYLVGLAFAFGWTPCVGPVLAAILFLAGSEESATQGSFLLLAYALGLGIPFLAASLAAEPFMSFMARFRGQVRTVERILGVLLVITGFLFMTGSMSTIAYWMLEYFPALGRIG